MNSIYKKKFTLFLSKTLITIGLFPFCSTAQTATNHYSLSQSIQIGLTRSLLVSNASLQRQIAKQQQRAALSRALPKLRGTANYSRFDSENLVGIESKSIGAEASWEIFSGGRTRSAIRAAKAYKQLTAFQERRIRETQAYNIALAYYQVQLATAQVEALTRSVGQLSDFESNTRTKFDAGTVSEFDWLSTKVSLANETPRLIAAENDLSLSEERFKNLTYINDTEFILTDPLIYTPTQIDMDQAIALGLKKRPELLEKSSAIDLRHEDVKQQKSEYIPSINLFAAYNYTNPDPYSFISNQTSWQGHWNAGIQANWNLFDGFLREANVSEKKLSAAIAEDEYRDLVRYVSLDIRTQWMRSRDAAEVIKATTENVQLAKRALNIARSRFDAGLSTNLEVTQANTELSDARLARAIALHEYMAAVTGIKHAMGTLLEEYE